MPSNTSGAVLVGAPPFPRHHGAWVMLWAPVAVAWASCRPAPAAAAMFVAAALCAFLAQHAAAALLQRRGSSDLRWWLAIEVVGLAISGISLVMTFRGGSILLLTAIGIGLFGVAHILWELGPAHSTRRIAGELARAWALALSGPAACVVAHGRLEAHAWVLYGASIAFFGTGVILTGLRLDVSLLGPAQAASASRPFRRKLLLFHLAAGALGSILAFKLLPDRAVWLAIGAVVPAYLIALSRAFGWSRWSQACITARIFEVAYGTWFTGFMIAALAMT
jgi:hypothetical protein